MSDELKFWCGRCGRVRVRNRDENCGCWERDNDLDGRMACGVCGERANFFFVHGYRCSRHHFQKRPSDVVLEGGSCIVTGGRYYDG